MRRRRRARREDSESVKFLNEDEPKRLIANTKKVR